MQSLKLYFTHRMDPSVLIRTLSHAGILRRPSRGISSSTQSCQWIIGSSEEVGYGKESDLDQNKKFNIMAKN